MNELGKCKTGLELLKLLKLLPKKDLELPITLHSGCQGTESGELAALGYTPAKGYMKEHLYLMGE